MTLPDLENESAQEILTWAFNKFGNRVSIASSFGMEDMVLIDMASKISKEFQVFTLDTGRLHEETYQIMDRTLSKYGTSLKVFFPDAQAFREEAVTVSKSISEFFYACLGQKWNVK